jgi:DNA-binding response OmpR family regulator
MAAILVVDDEPNVRILLRRILERAGHSVDEASNGVEALSLLAAKPFDLAILDVVMPEKGGIETLVDIRADFKALKIIVISGKVDIFSTTFQSLVGHFGASRILAKPFDAAELLREVESLLKKET